MTTTTEPETLLARHQRLQALKVRVDTELAGLDQLLRKAGLVPTKRPQFKPPTHTVDEAREAHRLYCLGQKDDPWVRAGEQQYQRERGRRRQAARRAV